MYCAKSYYCYAVAQKHKQKIMRIFLIVLTSAFLSFVPSKISAFELHCPQDYNLNCNEELWDLSPYGNAYYTINYVQYDAGLPHVKYFLNSCNTGHITRTWSVNDQSGYTHTCTQTLYVQGGDFRFSDITWPLDDLHLFGCDVNTHPNNLPTDYQRPTWNYVTCSQVASSFRDQEFNFGPDCKKIVRSWTVIDWCNYTGGSKGIYTYTQTIKISRDEAPLVSCVKEISVQATRCDSVFVRLPDISIEGESCTGDYIFIHDYPNANTTSNPSGMYPVGTTIVKYSVEYACGSEVICQTTVRVNGPGPVPYCLAELNVVLMPIDTDWDGNIDNGMVEIWANDVNVGSYHPCNNNNLQFSFSSDVKDRLRTFDCNDVGFNTVQMWVTDNKGNQSFCLVNINVQNNAGNIPNCVPDIGASSVVSGTTMDENTNPLSEVIITAKDRVPLYEYVTEEVELIEYVTIDSFYNQAGTLVYIYDTVVTIETMIVDSFARINVLNLYTDQKGTFNSNAIAINRNYEFTAYLADDMSEVDNMDLSLLANVVFGGGMFNNPYTHIAADINEDKVVDEEDFNILKDLINQEEDEWPKERQWIFFDELGMEEMSSNPLEDNLSETVEIPYISGTGNKVNFMGIQKGDLSRYEAKSKLEGGDLLSRSDSFDDIDIFPNPFNNQLSITGNIESDVQIKLYNLAGVKVLETTQRAPLDIRIDNKALPNGTYIYRILIGEEEVKTGKILKVD